MSGYSAIDGRQLVGFRGYTNESLTPDAGTVSKPAGGTVYSKSTLELRYPLSLNPNSTIFGLLFVEAGNDWLLWSSFNPFNVYRSIGFGIRVFLPMFGLLGLDWGYGLDEVPNVPGANMGQLSQVGKKRLRLIVGRRVAGAGQASVDRQELGGQRVHR